MAFTTKSHKDFQYFASQTASIVVFFSIHDVSNEREQLRNKPDGLLFCEDHGIRDTILS